MQGSQLKGLECLAFYFWALYFEFQQFHSIDPSHTYDACISLHYHYINRHSSALT